MVEYDKYCDEMELECNICGNTERFTNCHDFKDGISKAKSNGWKIQKEDDEWQHICQDCI